MKKPTQHHPIINCHTHIFTGNHVPPFLAKSFVWFPFHYLIHLPTFLWVFKKYLEVRKNQVYRPHSIYNVIRRSLIRLNKNIITKTLLLLISAWLIVNALFIVTTWLSKVMAPSGDFAGQLEKIRLVLVSYHALLDNPHWLVSLGIALFVFSFIKVGRNLIFFVAGNIWKFLKFVPGKQTKQLLSRYILLARYTLYKTQSRIFSKLKAQYPPGSNFIVLPMDMEYMGAGKLKSKHTYHHQMEELVELKNKPAGKNMLPFVFIDPRRIKDQQSFLSFSISKGKVELKACDVKRYMEDEGFAGFKIYPALGYYPFEPELLPLWKYAADRQIPIMTHCILGTIFYRGRKKKEWHTHPIFRESNGKDKTRPLELTQKKNIDFSINFTHPLNYLCLLHEPLLRKLVAKADEPTKTLFGFADEETPLVHNLSHLKICLAHFGGEEEWVKYLESDRNDAAQRLIKDRKKGINLSLANPTLLQWGVFEVHWKYTDWYSIICGLINQFPNVYSDISYILSKPRILPLLKETLNPKLNPHLCQRVLFGTDFYVVRNHFSDKDLMAQMTAGLTEEEFDRMARINPQTYLWH